MGVFLRSASGLCLSLLLASCYGEGADKYRQLGIAENCDAAVRQCEVSADNIVVSLGMEPDVRPLKPFRVHVVIEGGEVGADSVVADFQMQDMEMGINRYRLQRQSDSWQATVTLPVCSVSRMDWMATIEFTLNGRPFKAVFPFHSVAN